MPARQKPNRTRLTPRSLRVQLTAGSALVALVAVLVVTLAAVATVTVSFNTYQRTQFASEVTQLATALGEGRSLSVSQDASGSARNPFESSRFGGANIWVMDTSGHILFAPTASTSSTSSAPATARDAAVMTTALELALRGTPSESALPTDGLLPPLAQRIYAVAPVRLGSSSGTVIGAVALSAPASGDQNDFLAFLSGVNTSLFAAALGVALLAALAAALFSRRVTLPLAALTDATARMAAGDYAARVSVHSSDELQRLAASFNEMAAALDRDIAEIHRQELLRRELVANVSHELATPLTAIQGFTEALLDGMVRDAAGRDETIRTIAREAARLRRLVDQLRQVARFEAGGQALTRAPLPLAGLAEETLAVLAPEAARRGISMRQAFDAALPAVLADADRLTEVLLNLLDNALHHTQPGGTIELRATVEGAFVRVNIADTGPGIAPADRERIFERFYRTDYSRSSTEGGTGLGLAIVRALVEAHGGTIRADERPGGGTILTFTLPIAAPDAHDAGEAPRATPAPEDVVTTPHS